MEERSKVQVKEINQVCVVVKDLQASMERYASQFGIGPWSVYTFEPPAHVGTTVRGKPVFYRMRLALAQVGSLMWELIEPLEGNSIYAEFLREKEEGLHHVACFVEDFDQAIAGLQAQGIEILQSGNWHGVTYAYMDTQGPLGAILEFVKIPEGFVFPPPEATWPSAREFQPDAGAIVSAAIRALEWEKPPEERICEDPYARALIGEEGMEMARQYQQSPSITGLQRVDCDVGAIIVLRTRYIDDYIRRGLAQGIRQLVILGAGYDSRALRIEGLRQARIFEIDRPPNVADKMERVKRVAGQLPPQVSYLGIDFLEETLEDLQRKLLERGYDLQARSLFVLEGLVSHLSLQAVDELMRFISSFAAPGSSLVCTYPHGNMAEELERLRAGSEPTFGLDPPRMIRFLEERGFCGVHSLTLGEAHQLYRKGEARELGPYSFVEATVGEKT